jgi:DNA-binding HxlR family transcriptional regulator
MAARKRPTPKPGRPTKASKTGRPIMALIDLMGRRWSLRVIWELRSGPLTFRGLQSACDGLSPSVLNVRIAELREVAIVEVRDEGYALTPLGLELREALGPLFDWSARWAKALER